MMWCLSVCDQRRIIKLRNVCELPLYIYKSAGLMKNKPNLAQLHYTLACIVNVFNLVTPLNYSFF
jgi:hypothetical protein